MHALIDSNSSNTSLFIITNLVTPFSLIVYLSATKSIHPHRRGRPVTEPYSLPLSLSRCPSLSNSSVGKGPLPICVQYALKIPNTSPICLGEIPRPVHAPAQEVVEEVTNGYDLKSISSIEPCAPSASTVPPSSKCR